MPPQHQQRRRGVTAANGSQTTTDGTYLEDACAAALTLSSLWKIRNPRLLKQQPPAVPGAKLKQLLQDTSGLMDRLQNAIAHSIGQLQELEATDECDKLWELFSKLHVYKPLAIASSLITWMLTQPSSAGDIVAAVTHSPCQREVYVQLWLSSMDAIEMLIRLQLEVSGSLGEEGTDEFVEELMELGLFERLPPLLHDVVDKLITAGASVACEPVVCIINLLTTAQPVWDNNLCVGPVARIAADVQRCVARLPPPAAADATATADDSSSSTAQHDSTSSSSGMVRTTMFVSALAQLSILHQAQCCLHTAVGSDDALHFQLVTSKPFAEAGVQLMASAAHQLHAEHEAAMLQTPQMTAVQRREAWRSNSGVSPRRALQPLLLNVPAVHQRLKVVQAAAQQLYFEAAAVRLDSDLWRTGGLGSVLAGLSSHLDLLCRGPRKVADDISPQQQHRLEAWYAAQLSTTPALSASAVLLTVELALLLARRAHLSESSMLPDEAATRPATADGEMLDTALHLLNKQLDALGTKSADAGCAVRRQLLLRQSGQQLLQLLRVQVQRAVAGHAGKATGQDDRSMSAAAVLKALLTALNNATCDGAEHAFISSNNSGLGRDSAGAAELGSNPPSIPATLAAAHPVDYFVLLENILRAGLKLADALYAARLLGGGLRQPLRQMQQLLTQPAAVAAIVSALTGTAKAWARFVQQGASCPPIHANATQIAAGLTSAQAIPFLLKHYEGLVLTLIDPDIIGTGSADNTKSSSRSSTIPAAETRPVNQDSSCAGALQQSNSKILLTIVVARSLVVLSDALDAAAADADISVTVLLDDGLQNSTSLSARVININRAACSGLAALGLLPSAEHALWQDTSSSSSGTSAPCNVVEPHVAGGPPAEPPFLRDVTSTSAGVIQPGNSSGNYGGDDKRQAVKWSYLQQFKDTLQLASADKYVAVASQYYSSRANARQTAPDSAASAGSDLQWSVLHTTGVELCRELSDAVPVPYVCNNLCCTNLSGVSEASIAVKVCGGCGAAYCSAACQREHWRQHKKACQRMQAMGLRVA